jgi:DNA polymerase-3 subunit delta'
MIVGNKKNRELLESILKSDRCHQSFLFYGPEKIGKHVIAQTFARALTNKNNSVNWSENKNIDSDVYTVEPEIKKKKNRKIIQDISVNTIVNATHDMALAPNKKAKVLIINDAHRMTIAAQNALLKTLEEPRDKRYIILVTHKVNGLLDTLHSRCFSLLFNIVRENEIKDMYSNNKYIEDAYGRPGFLVQMHNDAEFRDIILYARLQLQQFVKKPTYERLELANELAKKDDAYIQFFLNVWIYRIWRAAHKTKKFQLLKIADEIETVLNKLQTTNVNKQLILEDLLINIM